jgi:hypothetical protein
MKTPYELYSRYCRLYSLSPEGQNMDFTLTTEHAETIYRMSTYKYKPNLDEYLSLLVCYHSPLSIDYIVAHFDEPWNQCGQICISETSASSETSAKWYPPTNNTIGVKEMWNENIIPLEPGTMNEIELFTRIHVLVDLVN